MSPGASDGLLYRSIQFYNSWMTAVIFKATHVCTACHVNFKCFRIEENEIQNS